MMARRIVVKVAEGGPKIILKRGWGHYIGRHDKCHPAVCHPTAVECNEIESENRACG